MSASAGRRARRHGRPNDDAQSAFAALVGHPGARLGFAMVLDLRMPEIGQAIEEIKSRDARQMIELARERQYPYAVLAGRPAVFSREDAGVFCVLAPDEEALDLVVPMAIARLDEDRVTDSQWMLFMPEGAVRERLQARLAQLSVTLGNA